MFNWVKDMKIGKKILVGFLIVAIIAACVGLFGIYGINKINNENIAMFQTNTVGVACVGGASSTVQGIRNVALNLVNAESAEDIQAQVAMLQEYIKQMDATMDKLIAIPDEGELGALVDATQAQWITYKGFMEQVIDNAEAGNMEMVNQIILVDSSEASNAIRDNFNKLLQLEINEARIRLESNAADAVMSLIVTVIAIILAVAIAVFLGIYISRIIADPIVNLTAVATTLALGDLDVSKSVKGDKGRDSDKRKDEIGALTRAITDLIGGTVQQVKVAKHLAAGDLTVEAKLRSEKDVLGKSLADVVHNLHDLGTTIAAAADQVASGSHLVSDSSLALSQGATEQASTVEELTASLEEISSQTSLNAQNADKANELTIHAKANANTGNMQMKEMLGAMDEINSSSAKIYKIIKVIEDIAFQTNILALNAAVEAARAGQHGKGFAVVAEEVRTLAARSSKAASETAEMIEDSIKKVDAGTKIAKNTAEALSKIVDEIDRVAILVDSIAVASKEQALGIEQVNQGIVQVSQVVQTNAATSEESAAASEQLSSQAAQLKEAIGTLKLKKSAGSTDASEGKAKAPEAKAPAKPAAPKPKISLSDNEFGKY